MVQAQTISRIIDQISYFHTIFIANRVGIDCLSLQERQWIESLDNGQKAFKDVSDVELSYRLAILTQEITGFKTDFDHFKLMIKTDNLRKLTDDELLVLRTLQQRAYNSLNSQKTSIYSSVQSVFSNAITQTNSDEKLFDKHKFAVELARSTSNWKKDFERIAATELHNAYDWGTAIGLLNKHGSDCKVVKIVEKNCCKHCNSLFNDKQGVPVIFTLSELMNNGTNIGRKVVDWKPVLGAVHPWCRCSLMKIPNNSEWNPKTKSFSIIKSSNKVERKSKVNIQVGDKKFTI